MTSMKILALRYETSDNNLFFGNRIEQTQKLFEITGASTGNLFVGNYIQGAFSFPPTLNCSEINTFYHNKHLRLLEQNRKRNKRLPSRFKANNCRPYKQLNQSSMQPKKTAQKQQTTQDANTILVTWATGRKTKPYPKHA
jgi:hypothetical protein